MQRTRPFILAVVLLALAGPAARAGDSAGVIPPRRSAFTLGIFGGGHLFGDEAKLGVAASPGATAGARSHGLAGLRAAIELRPWAAVEVEAFGMRTRDRTYDRPASIVGYRLNIIAHLLPGNLRPFALVGAGVLEVATTQAEGAVGLVRDRDGEFHVGVGLDYRLLEHVAVRADARAVQLPGKLAWSLTTDLEASLGVVFLFGAGPRLGVGGRVVAAPMPAEPAARKPVPREPGGPIAAPVVPAPSAAETPEANRAPAPAPQPSEGDGHIVTPPAAPDLPPPAPYPPAAPAAPPSPPAAGSPSPSRGVAAEQAASALPAPAAVAPPAAMPPIAMVTSRPVPTIPGMRGRLPSIGELLGRSKEIRFDGSSATKLSLVALPLIGQLAEAMAKAPDVQVEIVVHTAASGNPASDLALSKRRADAVKKALVEREVRASRLLSTGRGSAEPLAPSVTRSGRKLNERVELRVWTPEKMVR